MATIDDINNFDWPQDCNQQGAAFRQFQVLLNTLFQEWDDLTPPLLQINQDTPPTIADWESLWLSQGNALPIPENAVLLWFNTDTGEFGGIWTVFDDTIVREEYRFYHGRIDMIPFVPQINQTSYNTTAYLTTTTAPGNGPQAQIEITLQHPAYLTFSILGGIDMPAAAAILAYLCVKLQYRINATFQIIDQTQTNSGLFATDVTHPATTQAEDSQTEWNWRHPTLLAIGTHIVDFYATEHVASGGATRTRFSPIMLPRISTGSAFLQFINPTNVWEVVYD